MSRIRYELEYTYVPNADQINDMIRDDTHPLRGVDQIVAITWDNKVGAMLVCWKHPVFVDGDENA